MYCRPPPSTAIECTPAEPNGAQGSHVGQSEAATAVWPVLLDKLEWLLVGDVQLELSGGLPSGELP